VFVRASCCLVSEDFALLRWRGAVFGISTTDFVDRGLLGWLIYSSVYGFCSKDGEHVRGELHGLVVYAMQPSLFRSGQPIILVCLILSNV